MPFLAISCTSDPGAAHKTTGALADSATAGKSQPKESLSIPIDSLLVPDAPLILSRPQVPILCYHQVREYRPGDSKSARDYVVPPAVFEAQMKTLADSGFTTILPEQLYRYLVAGSPLPPRPVLISFDDGCDEQFDVTRRVLDPLGFKAAFFIMTVSVNRPNFMTGDQIRQLADDGHSIGLHTWDHHDVRHYREGDWVTQVEKPRAFLEKTTGRKIQFFAYPFGLWNEAAIPELEKRGFLGSFQLSTKRDSIKPLHTIRRIIVTGDWNGPQLLKRMNGSFRG